MDKVTNWIKATNSPNGISNGDAYNNFMGHWSALVAVKFISWLKVDQGRRWLDLGCGTGVLTKSILEYGSPDFVHGIDPTEDYIAHCKSAFREDTRASFSIGGYSDLQAISETYDAVVAGLMLNFADKPQDAVIAMRNITADNGIVGVYIWDYNQKMEMLSHFWEAVVELDSGASPFHESRRFKINDLRGLEQLFMNADFREIMTASIEVSVRYQNFEEYWIPFSGGQGPAGVYYTSLKEAQRIELKKIMRRRIKAESDGSFVLEARALAIKGRK